jgi:hypothetical protein
MTQSSNSGALSSFTPATIALSETGHFLVAVVVWGTRRLNGETHLCIAQVARLPFSVPKSISGQQRINRSMDSYDFLVQSPLHIQSPLNIQSLPRLLCSHKTDKQFTGFNCFCLQLFVTVWAG